MPVHRIEVAPAPGRADPRGQAAQRQAVALGLSPSAVSTAQVYLLQADLSPGQLDAVRAHLLTDPVTERSVVGAAPAADGAVTVEVHPLPGVMDPAAASVELAVRELLGVDAAAATGLRYDVSGLTPEQAAGLARRALANPVIHRVTSGPFHPAAFPRGSARTEDAGPVALRSAGDDDLAALSRRAHLFLSLEEMRAVREHFGALGRDPRPIELETIAQTWSEHCVHKTLKSTVRYTPAPGHAEGVIDWANRPGHEVLADGSVVITNLLRSTVAAATHELIADGVDWTLSVFSDNSGVIALDDRFGVCVKVETHNHPSAIEPYGGAATGIGGCIRDVIGTGLGAQPVASTDVFCVAHPDSFWHSEGAEPGADAPARPGQVRFIDAARRAPGPLPPGALHPRRTLTQAVAGVRDYGNRMGIPTVSGAVSFDDRYVGNPLVFCGCVGLIRRELVRGSARPGDRVVALGGRTGRDGIHGATFSSTELEHSSADEFAHAVQIGNAITQKQMLDAVLRARDHAQGPLFHAITDCGAGGFSSAVGEMGAALGAEVHLDRAPLKYPGLTHTEVWISEAQERMVLAVPPAGLDALRRICAEESVEFADLGHFGTPGQELVLRWHGAEVGRLSMRFLHEGIPTPTRHAAWPPDPTPTPTPPAPTRAPEPHATTAPPLAAASAPAAPARAATRPHPKDALLELLGHPNIASKHWIIRQYDHEVRGATVLKPLVGRLGRGPGNASVIEPVPGSGRGVAISQGLQTGVGDPAVGGDPYLMALAAVDECVRNLVCCGADPARIAILDNFSWPSCAKPANLGALVRAAEGCYDAAKAYRTPFVSGKDSLNNQLKYTDPATGQARVIEIPFTLLITGLGIVHDIATCVTSDAKSPGNALVMIGRTDVGVGGSHIQHVVGAGELAAALPPAAARVPVTDLRLGPASAGLVARLIARGLAQSAHDVSDGGMLVALAEMLIGGQAPGRPVGAELTLGDDYADPLIAFFGESPSRYLIEARPQDVGQIKAEAAAAGVAATVVGWFNDSGLLTAPAEGLSVLVADAASVWLRPLDW